MLTARELAKELMKNPDDLVCKTSENFELNHEIIPLRQLCISRIEGVTKLKQFRDAFDGTLYEAEIVQRLPSRTMFIQI